MDAREEKQYAMTTVLVRFLADNAAALAASDVAAAEAADIPPAYQRLTAAVGAAPLNTKATTAQATAARAALQQALPVVLGPLASIATKTADPALRARATLNAGQLRKMRPEELRDVAGALLDTADAHAADLKPYGLTKALLTQLRDLHTAFAGTVRGTSTLIDQRSQANATTSDLLGALMQQVYELDKPMEVFRLLNPALHAAYKQARRVGRVGSPSAQGVAAKA
ncbi:hypothetical protein MUN81_03445 [Hymenobacter sp. 5317J-9]|uniref:hypothetical protein n=1 Tax=Hymenobacter sp. 5317J-9 TaxID=2932250 RepID=UPI001FD6E0DE|nr:hypothetical protein [Hymenobacter sp. 5317J-9]UOR00109.1 hypothetical protein MUN81_03445 [Hymenobacter sp. 5317J-9]